MSSLLYRKSGSIRQASRSTKSVKKIPFEAARFPRAVFEGHPSETAGQTGHQVKAIVFGATAPFRHGWPSSPGGRGNWAVHRERGLKQSIADHHESPPGLRYFVMSGRILVLNNGRGVLHIRDIFLEVRSFVSNKFINNACFIGG